MEIDKNFELCSLNFYTVCVYNNTEQDFVEPWKILTFFQTTLQKNRNKRFKRLEKEKRQNNINKSASARARKLRLGDTLQLFRLLLRQSYLGLYLLQRNLNLNLFHHSDA